MKTSFTEQERAEMLAGFERRRQEKARQAPQPQAKVVDGVTVIPGRLRGLPRVDRDESHDKARKYLDKL